MDADTPPMTRRCLCVYVGKVKIAAIHEDSLNNDAIPPFSCPKACRIV